MFWFNFFTGLLSQESFSWEEISSIFFLLFLTLIISEDQIRSLPRSISQEAAWYGTCSTSDLWQFCAVFSFFSLEIQGIGLCWNSITIQWKYLTTLSFHMVKRPFPPFLVAVFGLEEQNCFLLCWLQGFSWMSCLTLLTQKEEEILSNPPSVISDGQ